MGFTILEPGEFTRDFVADVASFDAFCKESESRRNTGIAGLRDKHAAELSAAEKNENHIGAAVTEKERALKTCTEMLAAIQKQDKARQEEIYAKMTAAKFSGDSSAIDGLRAELFANEGQTKKERDAAWEEYRAKCDKIARSFEAGQREKDVKVSGMRVGQSREFKEYEAKGLNDKKDDIEKKINEFNAKFKPADVKEACVGILATEPHVEGYTCRDGDVPPARVRMGAILYDMSALNLGEDARALLETHYPLLYRQERLNIPYCTTFGEDFNYLFADVGDTTGREMIVNRVCSLAMRLFMAIQPGKVNFTFIDPIDLGHNFALFTRIVDVDDRTNKVINGKIWTSADDIGERLRLLTDHIANVTQRCLQGKYKSIQEYNAEAGQNAEPYQILMIMDFPGGFKEESLSMLEKVMSTGPKCGVYTVILKNGEQMAKTDARLRQITTNIEAKTKRFFVKSEGLWVVMTVLNENIVPFSINPLMPDKELNGENGEDGVIEKLKKGIKSEKKKVIYFDKRQELLPAREEWLKGNSAKELAIPIGISGVNKVQNLVFGASAYHALLIGQTGSGKSSLLHTIIMSSLIRYSADELSIFLVDFKRGVEFKIYANHALNVFRAVAIESEREFGGSVLAFLDKEQSRRAELFRRENVDNISAYREKKDRDGKNFLLPRILLIIDEFHVLFSKDSDTMGKNAAAHLEQIIKQGRAFGVHVVLASQTMANVGGIHQSLWGQVGIRIALKCPPSDAKLILSEDNDGVDLLAADEPGLAVYNSDCGNKVANTVFRVAYMEQDIQNEKLKEISELSNRRPPQTVFPETRVMVSNIEDNLYHPYQKFIESASTQKFPGEFEESAVLIGEPLSLSGKLRSVFKAKDASNMLIIGNDARKARAMFAFSALSLSIHAIAKNDWKKPPSQRVYIMDFAPPEEDAEHDVLLMLKKQIPGHVKYEEFDDSIDILKKLHENLSNGDEEERYLLIYGLQRARSLRQGGDASSGKTFAAADDGMGLDIAPKKPAATPYQMFMNILKDGPAKNTHAIIWVDNFKTFQAHYPGLLSLFDLRVGFTMADEDSVLFMEEPEGSQIGENNAVLSYNGNQKFRAYQTPDPGWLGEMCERINSF
jgi:hypothetical protein